MNNFSVIQLIDGILSRLRAVRPAPDDTSSGGPKQWLFVHQTKIPLEIELSGHATTLSAPSFPIPWEKGIDPVTQIWDGNYYRPRPGGLQDIVVDPCPLFLDGTPVPLIPRKGEVHYSVDFHLEQSLHGLRSVLLVLIDSCKLCARDEDFVGSQPGTDSLQVLDHLKSWSEDDFVPNAKYWKDWPLARFLHNPLPPKPKSWTLGLTAPIFGGETGKYYSRLATYDDRRPDSVHFYRAVFGLAQSKRGFATVPRSYIKKQLEKHATSMSTPSPIPDSDVARRFRVFMKTFLRDFKPKSVFPRVTQLEGSLRASFENPRPKGGAREYLRTLAHLYQGGLLTTGFNEVPGLPNDVFLGMREHAPGFVLEDRGSLPLTAEQWKSALRAVSLADSFESISPSDKLRSQIGKLLFLRALRIKKEGGEPAGPSELINPWEDHIAIPLCRVAPVLEPLKVRLITAMNALRSHVSRPIQSDLWTYLRTFPQFRLIGEEVSPTILHQLFTRHVNWILRRDLSPHEKESKGLNVISGDYAAATDGLNIHLSKIALEEILLKYPEEDQEYSDEFSSILLEQLIIYPGGYGIAPVEQRRGQLMGCVLSFPILCILNMFGFIDAFDHNEQLVVSHQALKEAPVLINGDDILFRCTDIFYESWLRSIDRVGFVPSVGKNFKHPRFFTVNSVPISYTPAPTPDAFWANMDWADIEEMESPFFIGTTPEIQIHGFLNVGLLTGQAKITGRESLGSIPLSGWHSGSVLNSMNPPQAHRWFLKYHLKEIQSQTRFGGQTLNIFAHPLKGGLGFQVPPGVEPRYSPEQRRLAEALYLSALHTYEGQEKDYSLKSLLLLETPSVGARLLGYRPTKVEVELYPPGTPLPEGYQPFVDESGIPPFVMTAPVVLPDIDMEEKTYLPLDVASKSTCRLSGSALRRLTRQYGSETLALHPLEAMTSFPFIPVRVNRVTYRRGPSGWEERAILPSYVPENVFQDVSLPDIEAPIEPTRETILEDWETQDIILTLPKTSDLADILRGVGYDDETLREVFVSDRPPSPTPPSLPLLRTSTFREAFTDTGIEQSSNRADRPFNYRYSRKGGSKW